jgi:hypothetical protein
MYGGAKVTGHWALLLNIENQLTILLCCWRKNALVEYQGGKFDNAHGLICMTPSILVSGCQGFGGTYSPPPSG